MRENAKTWRVKGWGLWAWYSPRVVFSWTFLPGIPVNFLSLTSRWAGREGVCVTGWRQVWESNVWRSRFDLMETVECDRDFLLADLLTEIGKGVAQRGTGNLD